MQRPTKTLAAGLLVVLLAACGGGGSDEPPVLQADPLSELPASASQSSAGLAGYVTTLASLPAESREPVAVDGFNPPRPDDVEPQPLA
jgi:hypothetical protein